MKSYFGGFIIFSLLFVSCKKEDTVSTIDQNFFKIDTEKYELSKAYYDVFPVDGYTGLIIISPGLTFNRSLFDFSGKGNFIEFDISDISSTLKTGNYVNPAGFFAGIALNYSINSSATIEYEIKNTPPGKLNITKLDSTYNIQFEFTLANGKLVTGQYKGKVEKF